jgi:hypothetical protein
MASHFTILHNQGPRALHRPPTVGRTGTCEKLRRVGYVAKTETRTACRILVVKRLWGQRKGRDANIKDRVASIFRAVQTLLATYKSTQRYNAGHQYTSWTPWEPRISHSWQSGSETCQVSARNRPCDDNFNKSKQFADWLSGSYFNKLKLVTYYPDN